MMTDRFKEMCDLCENKRRDISIYEILGNSLFYYCCGFDPSPIIAFGTQYQIYIYCDNFAYVSANFDNEILKLYSRLESHNHVLATKHRFTKSEALSEAENVELTEWMVGDNKSIFLLFIQGDARRVFEAIYDCRDANNYRNLIKPKCICNFRNEFNDNSSCEYFHAIEKRVDYIFGYGPASEKYKVVSNHPYYGDYEDNATIELHKRKFWCLY